MTPRELATMIRQADEDQARRNAINAAFHDDDPDISDLWLPANDPEGRWLSGWWIIPGAILGAVMGAVMGFLAVRWAIELALGWGVW